MKILVTGGAGFIGAAVTPIASSPLYAFEQADIGDRPALDRVFTTHKPDAVMHLTAENHVDRPIDGPGAFIETDITGTYYLLEAARQFSQAQGRPEAFRFHHISTAGVFGSLGPEGQCSESTPYGSPLALALCRGGSRRHPARGGGGAIQSLQMARNSSEIRGIVTGRA